MTALAGSQTGRMQTAPRVGTRASAGWFGIFRQTFADWNADQAPQLGAALAFYTALSIAPLIAITLRIVGAVFGQESARNEIERQIGALVGAQGADAVRSMLATANEPETGTYATVLSVLTLLFGASGVFGQLQSSLNAIWEVTPKGGRGIAGIVRDRFLSVTMVLGVAFLLLVSLLISAALSFAGAYAIRWPEELLIVSQIANQFISLAVYAGLFALLFKYVPDVRIAWRDVWHGAVMTAALFTVGKFAIGLYLGRSAFASSYGVAGSLVALLVWVYYSAQIVFFGAELTQVYAEQRGARVVPATNARNVTAAPAHRTEGLPAESRQRTPPG